MLFKGLSRISTYNKRVPNVSTLIEGTKRPSRIIILILLSLVAGSLLSMVPVRYLPFFVGVALLGGVAVFCMLRPAFLIYIVILSSAGGGLLRASESLRLGGTSLSVSGLRWVFVGGIALLVLGVYNDRTRIPTYVLPFLFLIPWTVVRLFVGPFYSAGLKDILFYSLPPLMGIYTFSLVSMYDKSLVSRIEKALLCSVLIPPILYAVLIPAGLITLTRDGPRGVMVPRAIAVYLLVVLALSLALWRYGATGNARRMGFLISLLALGTIFFTLSRMASLTALIVLAISRLNPRKLWQLLLGVTVAALLASLLLLMLPSFRERSSHIPEADLTTRVQFLHWYGRDQFWPITLNSAVEKPFFGWGPGSARLLVARALPWKETDEYHPHNEYLQIFHDLGIIGLVLLLLAWIPLLIKCWESWRDAHASSDSSRSKWNMAATLAVLAILATSITGNTLHYAFVTVPTFVITTIAYSLGPVTQNKRFVGKVLSQSPGGEPSRSSR